MTWLERKRMTDDEDLLFSVLREVTPLFQLEYQEEGVCVLASDLCHPNV